CRRWCPTARLRCRTTVESPNHPYRSAFRSIAPAPWRSTRLFRLRPSSPRWPRSARLRDRGPEGVVARCRWRRRLSASRHGRPYPRQRSAALRSGAPARGRSRQPLSCRRQPRLAETKVSETGAFVITGFTLREAIAVAELKGNVLKPAGLVKFGLAGKDLWQRL